MSEVHASQRQTDTGGRRGRTWFALLAMLVLVTAWLGRDVLARLGTSVMHDDGDPILTAMFMRWNAQHVPYTEAWWQFPGFYRTPDVLAFSEHLLGYAPLSTPLTWLTGNPLATYNIVMLLTFPLAGVTMFLLVRRLTGHDASAALAALAFAFGPYKMAALSHVQLQAAFWLPLALLGLHAYIETPRRRWLALYAVSWLMASMSNGYLLVAGSLLIGLWGLWFVVARRRWAALGAIAAATLVAALPLVPILVRYVSVQTFQGLTREEVEIQMFSADVFGVLCAAPWLTVWGGLQSFCRPEGWHFPGVVFAGTVTLGVCAFAFHGQERRETWTGVNRWRVRAGWGLVALALVYAGIAIGLLISGRPRIEAWIVRASYGSTGQYLWIALVSGLGALAVSPAVQQAVRRLGTIGFYLTAAIAMWLISLGPRPVVAGAPTGWRGPYWWLMSLPGMHGLRAPGRFWMMSVLCLCVVLGLVLAPLLRRQSRAVVVCVTLVLGAGLVSDGWVGRFRAADPPFPAPDARVLAGGVVMELPLGGNRDIGPLYRAMTGGWTPVNGYSGYAPIFYVNLERAAKLHDDGIFDVFRGDEDLHVIVGHEDPELHVLTARQPGAVLEAENAFARQYRLPRTTPFVRPEVPAGRPHRIARLTASCAEPLVGPAADGDDATYWSCGPGAEGQTLTADLGGVQRVSTVVHGLDLQAFQAPRAMTVETSTDGRTWTEAWRGNTVGLAVVAARAEPTTSDLVFAFAPREARYVRLTNRTGGPAYWVLTELAVY